MMTRTLALCAFLLAATAPTVFAQDKTEGGYALAWTHTLQEQVGQVAVKEHLFPGWSFMVHECSAGEAMAYWQERMRTMGGNAKGSNPVRVTGAIMPGQEGGTMLIFATAKMDRSADGVRITVAFALNDSTAAPEAPGMAAAVHDMAVQVNRAVVQAQVDAQDKRYAKIGEQLEDAQRQQASVARKKSDAGKQLDKVNAEQARLARKRTDLQDKLNRLEEAQRLMPDPRNAKDIAGVRQDLISVEHDIVKQQKAEADALADLNKHREQVPEAEENQQESAVERERATKEMEALKHKLGSIR